MKKGLCRRKEEGSSKGGGRNNGGLRPPEAHGSGGTSVAHAFGQQLHTAQHVGSESRSQNREPPCRSGGPDLEGWKEPQLVFAHPFLEPSTSDHPWGSPNLLQVPLSKDEDLPA